MNYLLDTNVLSEAAKPRPNQGVIQWLEGADEDRLFISVISLAELHRAVERLPEGKRRTRLREWLGHEVRERFQGRILPIDEKVAESWGRVMARQEGAGRPMASIDGFLAASARVHQMTLVTRNTADFQPALRDLLNPWI